MRSTTASNRTEMINSIYTKPALETTTYAWNEESRAVPHLVYVLAPKTSLAVTTYSPCHHVAVR